MNISEIKEKIGREKGKKEQIEYNLTKNVNKQKELEEKYEIALKAQEIILAVAKQTQEELSFCIENPVNLALKTIYGKNVENFKAEFKILERGGTECNLLFEKNESKFKPIDFGSGGKIDIASFALILSSLAIAQPQKRPVLFLDEPFRFVAKDKINLIGSFLKEVCKPPPIGLGLQIVLITHIEELKQFADNLIELEMINDVTKRV